VTSPSALALALCLSPAARAAEGWFYPGAGPQRVRVDADGLPAARTGRVLVDADDPAALAALPEVARVQILRGRGHVALLHLGPGADDLALSRALHDRADVRWAHPDLLLQPTVFSLPDDPYLSGQWHLENTGQNGWTPDVDIDAERAWAVATGLGGLIAVIDSGIDTDHPDLDVVPGHDYIDADDDPNPVSSDESGPHGTSAAGLAAAMGDNGLGVAGVADDSQIYAIRLIGGNTTTSDLYDAFVEATDAGAWVLSNSWGFDNGCSSWATYGVLAEAMDYAETQGRGGLGAAVVAAAGNGSCDNSGDGFLKIPTVIGVSASSGDDVLEWYSSFGDNVDVAGPSGNMLTTDIAGDEGYGSYLGDPDYNDSFSGTSAAAPVVSGVLALMFQANPRLSAAQARQILCETAQPIDVEGGSYDTQGWSPYYGCGRVNAGDAVLAVVDQGPPQAPVLDGPVDAVSSDRVLLRWEPAVDPDDDRVQYELSWSVNGGEVTVLDLDGTVYDLTGRVVEGDLVSWQVQARDAWGPGEGSEPASFEVVAPAVGPEPLASGRCAAVPGGGGLVGLLVGLLAMLRRRSSSKGRSSERGAFRPTP